VNFIIDWSQQHCGVRSAPYHEMLKLMPDLDKAGIFNDFPDNVYDFSWDVKVHMLMPRQYPCIPNWHTDNVPRINGIQRFELCRPELPMYLWLSGGPLTQFKHGFLTPKRWHRFNQLDEHRGIAAQENCWRGFIRATHYEIKPFKQRADYQRRHCQVYLDENGYQW
jgi:hypothetical protein